MSSKFLHLPLAVALSALPTLWVTPALADEQERQYAIDIGQTAIELYDQGQFKVALERFRTADRMSHSPVFALYEARCLEKLGQLVDASRVYERVAAESLPADAPPAWRAASNDAARELGELSKRIPSVRIVVSGGAAATFQLDAAPLEAERANTELLLDPGPHTIEARSADGRAASVRFELGAGERGRTIALNFAAPAEPVAPTSSTTATGATGTTGTTAPSTPVGPISQPATDALGITLLSLAGVGLAAGAVTGWIAADRLADIRENCVGDRCLKSDAGAGDTVDTLALVSTIGFAVGCASLGAWAVRVIVTPATPERSAATLPSVRVMGTF